MISFATVVDDLQRNSLLEYFLIDSVFEPIVQLLASPADRELHGDSAVLLLTLLISYRKYDNINPYIVKLSILDDELVLNVKLFCRNDFYPNNLQGYSHVISAKLTEKNVRYQNKLAESESKGMLSTVTNLASLSDCLQ
jgi:hypothetical protein